MSFINSSNCLSGRGTSNASCHCGSNAECLTNADEVVMNIVNRQRRYVVFQLLSITHWLA
jgi:hypothetical protein